MSVAKTPAESNKWADYLEDGHDGGARVFARIDDPAQTRSLHLTSETKHDPTWWHAHIKPRYARSVCRALSFNPYKSLIDTSTYTDKTTIGSDKTTLSVRVTYLTDAEWTYWRRRFNRDSKVVANLTYLCGIPQANKNVAAITHGFYAPMGGRVYEGQEEAFQAVLSALDGHDPKDRTRRIRATRGQPLREQEEPAWKMIAFTKDQVDSWKVRLDKAKEDGTIKFLRWSSHEGKMYFSFDIVGDIEEGRKKLGLVPHVAKTSKPKRKSS